MCVTVCIYFYYPFFSSGFCALLLCLCFCHNFFYLGILVLFKNKLRFYEAEPTLLLTYEAIWY